MQFNTKVKAAHFNTANNSWKTTDEFGKTYTSRWLITCMGILSEPTLPAIPGVHDFKGQGLHTARWPEKGIEAIRGKRVGIIGTGATAIQTIQEIKSVVGSLTVFQRTANWTAPLRNTKIDKQEMAEIRSRYPQIFETCAQSGGCFIHGKDPSSTFDMGPEEREAHWEMLYAKPGFSKWLSNFRDISTDREANRLFSEFIAKKIRARVNDPAVAEKLILKNHGFGTRRVPLEGGYYEAFNQPNADLVDLTENPIEKVTETGIKTKDVDFELDVIIYATGFDAVTGSFRAVDFKGVNGVDLSTDMWGAGIRTYLGLTVQNFPNMFMIMGPHQMFGNIPRSIEYAVDWASDFIAHAVENNITYCEATEQGMDEWDGTCT
jgi:cation diffusion facilitator CzcD-associated flavoprotein CzcO